ncbi:MAG TPA: iron transporter FeoA [Lactobacillus sp.]|nr:iron transporter FeoA [Lactobacillus sp.]
MELQAHLTANEQLTVQCMNHLEKRTFMQLHRLGIEPGSVITIVRRYPFHGPVIIEFDHQQLGVRDNVLQTLIGG